MFHFLMQVLQLPVQPVFWNFQNKVHKSYHLNEQQQKKLVRVQVQFWRLIHIWDTFLKSFETFPVKLFCNLLYRCQILFQFEE